MAVGNTCRSMEQPARTAMRNSYVNSFQLSLWSWRARLHPNYMRIVIFTSLVVYALLGPLVFYLFDPVRQPQDVSKKGSYYNGGYYNGDYRVKHYSKWIYPGWSTADIAHNEQCFEHFVNTERLPDTVIIPLEKAVEGQELEYWHEEWVENGTIAGKIPQNRVDVVITWVNGTEQAFIDYMSQYAKTSILGPDWLKQQTNRHRSFDEIRFNLRSLNLLDELGKVQIITTRRGQSTMQSPSFLADTSPYDFIAYEDLYKDSGARFCAPSFSSYAIDALIPNLPPTGSDGILDLNDDMALGSAHSPADIQSPLFGTPFMFDDWRFNVKRRMQVELNDWSAGEEPHLLLSSWLLNIRFGHRPRQYVQHFGKALSRSVLQELKATFPSGFEISMANRFRGEVSAVSLSFLYYHFVIGRHREAMLWSYLNRIDRNMDGIIDAREMGELLRDTERGEHMGPVKRVTLEQADVAYDAAGLKAPKASRPHWTSWDGPMPDELHAMMHTDDTMPPTYPSEHLDPVFDRVHCLADFYNGRKNITVDELLETLTEERLCVDAILQLVLRLSGEKGLKSILPPIHHPARRTSIKALTRYAYTVANLDADFFMMVSAQEAEDKFRDWMDMRPAQICVNDDVEGNDPMENEKIRNILNRFTNHYYPLPANGER